MKWIFAQPTFRLTSFMKNRSYSVGAGRRAFSTAKGNGRKSSEEGLWIVGAITIMIPTGYWIYKNHFSPKHAAKNHFKQDTDSSIHSTENRKELISLNALSELKEEVRELVEENEPVKEEEENTSAASAVASNEIKIHYLLVGGGVASFAAATSIKEIDPEACIMIVSDEEYQPYMRPPLSKELWWTPEDTSLLTFKDWHGNTSSLFFHPIDQFDTHYSSCGSAPSSNLNKVKLLLGRRVAALNVNDQSVTLDDGRKIFYEKVLIATGGRPKLLPVLAESSLEVRQHVSTFRNINDFRNLQAILSKNTSVTIVGGGFLGSELASAIAQYSKNNLDSSVQINQIFPEEGNMALVFPKYLSRWTTKKLKGAGVNIQSNTQIDSATFNTGTKQVILNLSNGKTINTNHVILAIGIEPNDEIAQVAGLERDKERGGILTNSELQAKSNVFVAGDVLSFYDSTLGIRRRIEHYDHAFLSGKLAGYNMVNRGRMEPFRLQSMFWSDLGPEISFEAVGLIDSRLTTVGVWAEGKPQDTAKVADLDPSDIRVQPIGDVVIRKPENIIKQQDSEEHFEAADPQGKRDYGKGVVFYVKDGRIVGTVMFNLFNRLSIARDVISRKVKVEDLQDIVELFNINE